MNVSSRTPEGFPSHCPLCGSAVKVDFSEPVGDAPCSNCGHLLWKSNQILASLRQSFGGAMSVAPDEVHAETSLQYLQADSVDVVELVMELEDEFGITISDDEYERLLTIADVTRFIEQKLRNE